MKREHIFQLGRWVYSQVTNINFNCVTYPVNTTTGAGLCAVSSVAMQRCLTVLNHQSWVIEAFDGCYFHCWVEDNRYAIDLTSRQFNHRRSDSWPDVLILKKEHYAKLNLIEVSRKKAGKHAVRKIYTDWHPDQNPSTYNEEINKIASRARHLKFD